MKMIFGFFSLALLPSAFVTFGATQGFAQDPCADTDAITAADAKVRENYLKIETLRVALDAGKDYIGKYATCEGSKTFVDWLKPQLPAWEKDVKNYEEGLWRKPRVDKFDAGMKNARYDDAYSAGAELLAKYPDNMSYMLPLGLIGLYESYKNNFKHNEDSLRYAKMAIDKLKAGGVEPRKDKGKPLLDTTGKEVYGSFQFVRNKEEAISELTYALAHINYYAKKDRKAALPYYYAVTEMPGIYKDEPRLFVTLGSYYGDESAPIGKEIVALIEKLKAALTDEEKEKLDVEIKAKEALYNGYTERALDAFGRAYRSSDEKITAEKTLKGEVYKTLQSLYERRFGKKDGLDAYILASTAKPLLNPTTEVTPASDPEPPKSATTVANATSAVPSAVKPAATNGKAVPAAKPAAANSKAGTSSTKRTATKGKAARTTKRPR